MSTSIYQIYRRSTKHPINLNELIEDLPDHGYRLKSNLKKEQPYRIRELYNNPGVKYKSYDRGHKGDLAFMQVLTRKFGTVKHIPLGFLLDELEKGKRVKRNTAHFIIRRLWKKGMIRRFIFPDERWGIWYILQPQDLFFTKGSSVYDKTSINPAIVFRLDDLKSKGRRIR